MSQSQRSLLSWPRPEFREILFEIWAEVDFAETFAKFGGVSTRNKNVGEIFVKFGGSLTLLQHEGAQFNEIRG